jgi:hypothetical protein
VGVPKACKKNTHLNLFTILKAILIKSTVNEEQYIYHIVACRPILGNDRKQVPMATNQHATTEKLLEAVFFVVRTVAAAVQWHGKHIYAATNPDATI